MLSLENYIVSKLFAAVSAAFRGAYRDDEVSSKTIIVQGLVVTFRETGYVSP